MPDETADALEAPGSVRFPERFGPYRVEARLGAGGMGEVYSAYDERLERRVAVKLIRPESADSPAARERFRREARAAAALNHPAIVQVYDVLRTEHGDAIVMEYVEGDTLARLLRADAPAPEAALALAAQVAEGLAELSASVAFDKLLGGSVSVKMKMGSGGSPAWLNGICRRVAQLGRDATFILYRLEVVPRLWTLTRTTRSRIFQRLSVPDILDKVLTGFEVRYELRETYEPRDYCAQYRESDFAFASRLMEEEGLFYFFKHAEGRHEMVVADNPEAHPQVPGETTLLYEEVEGGTRDEERVHAWEKRQELRSGACLLWDHCFELPHRHLDAREPIQSQVPVGKVDHKLAVGGNAAWELYDHPGRYAQRFDGVGAGGGDQPAEVDKLFKDNARTVKLRMQAEAAQSLGVRAAANARHLRPGHRFKLKGHWNADAEYVVTETRQVAEQTAEYRSGNAPPRFECTFTCLPKALPFRPARTTPLPVIPGPQTAVVVGPRGEELFPDKYGRVKVQFHWDRDGRNDLDSSCWVRVATPWAGRQWGLLHLPRVGQEVVVAFEEGDPDRPLIVGSVYNADMLPPWKLPAEKALSGLRSRSTPKGGPDNYNEISFDDKKGEEKLNVQAERNCTRLVKHDDTLTVKHDRTITVTNNRSATIEDGNDTLTVKQGKRTVTLDAGDHTLRLKAGDQSTKLDAGKSTLEAMQSIELKVGPSRILIDASGVKIEGPTVSVEGTAQAEMKSPLTTVSADGVLTVKGGVVKIN